MHLVDFQTIFPKGDRYCDFLFAFMNTKSLSELSPSLKEIVGLPWVNYLSFFLFFSEAIKLDSQETRLVKNWSHSLATRRMDKTNCTISIIAPRMKHTKYEGHAKSSSKGSCKNFFEVGFPKSPSNYTASIKIRICNLFSQSHKSAG